MQTRLSSTSTFNSNPLDTPPANYPTNLSNEFVPLKKVTAPQSQPPRGVLETSPRASAYSQSNMWSTRETPVPPISEAFDIAAPSSGENRSLSPYISETASRAADGGPKPGNTGRPREARTAGGDDSLAFVDDDASADCAHVTGGPPRKRPVVGEEGGDSDDYNMYRHAQRMEEEYENDVAAGQIPAGERGGCCMQLAFTMKRILLLMRREWCATACEFLLPIIFVIGTVVLWAILGTDSADAGNYFDLTAPQLFSEVMTGIRSSMCISPDAANISTFPPCDQQLIDDKALYCPEGRGIPVGLCYNASLTVAAVGIASLVQGKTAIIPSFDDIVALHWCNMDEAYNGRMGGTNAALMNGGQIYFTPDTAETKQLVDYMNESSQYFDLVFGGIYADKGELDNRLRYTTMEQPPNWAIIQVNSLDKSTFNVDVRVNASSLPGTAAAVNSFYVGGLGGGTGEMYLLSGFTTLQTMVYDFYFQDVLGLEGPMPRLTFTPMPTKAFEARTFISFGGQLAPLILVLGYLYPVAMMTKRIVVEKELRIREAMLIMGLSEPVMYLGWFIIYVCLYLISSLIMAIIIRFTYLPNTDMGYTFFMLFFFAISIVCLSGCLASLFSKSRLSAVLAPIIYFVMAVPLFAMQSAGPSAKTGILILSPSALAVGFDLLFQHESGGGAQASTLQFSRDDPNLLVVFAFLFFDSVIYIILMIYFDLVIPKDWGTTKNPFFFIIDPIKWCCCRNKDDDDDNLEDGRAADGVFEPVEDEESAAVRILGLRKKFKRGGKKFLAVNNLYWSLKEGEISVLLGHNGAGKSTTMNLMTGMLEADGGDCLIYGRSIISEKSRARQEIGLCPQHNILWPKLTVAEHLEYFAAIKGLKGDARKSAVERLMRAVDLEDKRDFTSRTLSGGQKRKLSVAIAFVGGSRLVFLDEPTAGMDVGARRHTWGLLKEMAKHHTILLSTHFMDEADLLGNTVAIMSQGRMQCSGSNMFLKSKLGIGFVLTMSVVPHVNRKRIDGVIRQFVPSAESLGSGAGEVSFRLPMDSRQEFPALLSAIEARTAELGVNAYSISATTLEEVFLRIANGEDEESSEEEEVSNPDGAPDTAAAASAVWNVNIEESTCTLHWLQFRAMIIKRFWNALRDRRTQFFQIICPVLCVLLAMLLTLVKILNTPPIDLTSSIYTGEQLEIPLASCDDYLDVTTPFAPDVKTILWNSITTGQAFSDELMKTYDQHERQRYGGAVCNGVTFPSGAYSGIFYNTSANHEVGIMTANFYNARLRKTTNDASATMKLQAVPLPKSEMEEAMTTAIYGMMISVIVMIPFTFIPSTFVGWIVKERECKARHLQNVSGLNFYIYWISNFVFDLACYVITMFLVIAVFGIFQREEYIGKDAIGATILAFLLYGISGILMAYCLSFLFDSHSTAQNVVMLVNFIVGFLLVLGVLALEVVAGSTAADVARILKWIFRIIPTYCVGESISNLTTMQMYNALGDNLKAFDMKVIGWPCVYMAIEVPAFAFICLFVDHPGRRQRSQRLFHNPNATPEQIADEDPDVVAERDAVLNDPERESDLVNVEHMRKEYANGKVAVRNITFGVKPGEVFGFLGTNGAGKTTTISILCQEFYPTSGRASICGYDIVEQSQRALRCIGYCPQFDACLDLLTVEEHLQLYAGVRGITSKTKDAVVEGLMKLCELTDYRKTKSNELSGGNRRKLSVAVSLIGGPRVVFLDEPSAGMDPVARRGLWNAIETVADNCSVVLTTHHLEEVEALAHRVAIMVDGTLRCIGDKTHLKQKYGTGFEVTVRVTSEDRERVDAVKQFFNTTFPSCELVEERSGRLTYQLENTVKLSEVFSQLETAQKVLSISDYNVSQTSIEQVFMRISEEAEAQAEEERLQQLQEKEKKCCGCCC